jgi:hypothetical protein
MDRLHPETLRTLEQMIKIHGADRLIKAIREIEKKLAANNPPRPA